MRFLAATVLVIILAGCASARHRPVSAPFVQGSGVESQGMAVIDNPGHSRGTLIAFIPTAKVGIGVVLQNLSDSTVVVSAVRAVEPQDSVTDQIGTNFLLDQQLPCRGISCAGTGFSLFPFATAAPQPVSVDAGKYLAVALGFRLAACPAASVRPKAAASAVVVTYRVPGKSLQQQTLPLGYARLLLRSATCNVRG